MCFRVHVVSLAPLDLLAPSVSLENKAHKEARERKERLEVKWVAPSVCSCTASQGADFSCRE